MAPVFQPFDWHSEFRATHRNLPHWHQPGATYFVTFRLSDSLSAEVLEQFEERRLLNDPQFFAWMERYLDAGSGPCPLKNPAHAITVTSTLRYFDGLRYALGAYVVMPNHVHALVQPVGAITLTSILQSWKSYTAHELQRRAGIIGRVWQQESFDRIVRDEVELKKFTDYILANPAAAHLQPGTFSAGQGSANWFTYQ
jgi:Transposase IS200 like